MKILQVLVDAEGKVLGTSDPSATGVEAGPTARLIAGPNQRIVEVTVDDEVAHLAPAALHEALKARI